jgi:hypothetical protein
MATTTKEIRLTGFNDVAERTEASESVRHMQNSLLSELPGVTFAFLTLAYVAFSLLSL